MFGPPEGGYFSKPSCSRRLSSASWLRMYSRIACSSRPTVDTKYPRAQKLWPVKFLTLPCMSRATAMALLPLIKPITSLTECFGGIAMHSGCGRGKGALRLFRTHVAEPTHGTRLPDISVCYCTRPCVCTWVSTRRDTCNPTPCALGWYSSSCSSLLLLALSSSQRGGLNLLPHKSNSTSPPAKPGDYLIYLHRRGLSGAHGAGVRQL